MANDGFTILNPGVGGAAMDESELNYGSPPLIRKRERVVLGGDSDPAALCDPIATIPAGGEFGLPVRQVGKLQVEGVPGGVPISVDLVIGDTVTTNQGTPNSDPNSWPVHQVGSAPLPVGAATDAGLAAIFGRQADGSQHTIVDNFPASQPVTGPLTDAQLRAAAVPVSLAAAPLPANAATEATLALIKAKTDNLDVLLSSRAVTGLTDAQLRASAVPVDVSDRAARLLGVLSAGANTIGKVDQGAGGASAWKVDGSAVTQPVSGPLTDAQLRASAVPVDVNDRAGRLLGVLSAGANIIGKVGLDAANLAGIALDATVAAIRDRLPASLIGGRLDVNVGASVLPTGAATSALQTSGAQKTQNVDGAGNVRPAGDVAARPIAQRLSDGAAFYDAAKTGQLPAALVGGRLDENLGAWLGSTAPTVGQKTAANSLPVVLCSDQNPISVNQNSRTYAGRYGASIARLTGSTSAQNIASIENPAASGKTLYIRKIKISASSTASAIVNFQFRLHRTTAVPTGGSTQTAQKRATADAAAIGIVRSAPTATAAAGTLWAAAGPSLQNNPTTYASEAVAWDSEGREEDDVILAAGEGILLLAEANDTDFNFSVSYFWGEV